ncbi:questin oxidase family protein [Undibacterium sp. Ji49W]|uniref:questin oxidase family protein n=1 Tax=Undibacterium sp. Ji49W TaxID=3413040 RepID=UPI003BF04C1D
MKTLATYPVLRHLLDENRQFALGGRGTTNHCPMALTALAAMGASAERLEEFFDHWHTHYSLPAEVSPHEVNYADFASCLGERPMYAGLQNCFQQRIMERGSSEVVREVLATIPVAPATSAFHALIRLSYGLQSGHDAEIAAGLAALVVANFAIDIPTFAISDRLPASSVADGFRQIADGMGGKKFEGRMITEKMAAVIRDRRFIQVLPAMPVTSQLLDELARWAIAAYWQTGDFTILHMVTGVHAIRQLIPYLHPLRRQALCSDAWLALCVAYASVGAPALLPEQECLDSLKQANFRAPSWDYLFNQAILNNDDHAIKFTYTCSREYGLHAHPFHSLYQAAAMRMLDIK